MDLFRYNFLDPKSSFDKARQKIMRSYPTAVDVLFKLVDFNEYGRRGSPSGVHIELIAFPVIKLTPKGGWYIDIADDNKKKLVTFAKWKRQSLFYEHQASDMVNDFKRRKTIQNAIALRTFQRSAHCLALIKLRGRVPKRGMPFDQYDFKGNFDDLEP